MDTSKCEYFKATTLNTSKNVYAVEWTLWAYRQPSVGKMK